MSGFNLAQDAKVVNALKPQVGAALTGAYVSLKNYAKAYLVFMCDQANAATIALTIEQASAVAGTGSKVITNNVPIWANQDCAASDALVRQTDGVAFTTSAALKIKMVIFEIKPASLDVANGFDCVVLKAGASNAANIYSAHYVLVEPRFHSETPESSVVD